MRFVPHRINFAAAGSDDAEDADIPKPLRVKIERRRAAGIREAKETLQYLPGPGESLHAVMTARLSLCDVLAVILESQGRCDKAFIATLGYNRRNFRTMLSWLDTKAIGTLSLVGSKFFQSHNGDLALETIEQFRSRGSRAVFAPCHAKVVALHFQNGVKMSVEGSSNLCSNGSSLEQFAVINDPDLCDWFSSWIDELVVKYEGTTSTERTG